ncbi:MAG TPA: branched-chain amino acid ABC transporter permease, partial [Devosia sp.]|nr:branched-chain amino acid ABC transporter permease [Devosia sp.]
MRLQLIGFAVFAVVMIAIVPPIIEATGRSDLYYTLTLISILAVASAGVWITFYIGRINIGQAAYALIGGYVSAILVLDYGVSFWWTIPIAGLVSAVVSILIGLPILRLRGVYFAMVTLVSTEV